MTSNHPQPQADTARDSLQVVWMPIGEIHPYERNPRFNDEAVEKVANSIKQFGWKVPIVVSAEGEIVAGHTRYKAALSLGMESVPCIVASDLDAAKTKAFRLADNKTGELASWDWEKLDAELAELSDMDLDFDMGDFGFDMAALGAMGEGAGQDEPIEPVEGEDDVPQLDESEPPDSVPGAVYALGTHRLMCGDSTDAAAVKKLMGGERADICFSSPPYNLLQGGAYKAKNVAMHSGKAYASVQDNMTDEQYAEFLAKAVGNAIASCDDALFNIGILDGSKHGVAKLLAEYADNFCDIIVWNKKSSMPSGLPSHRALLTHRCELIFCFNQSGSRSFSHPQWSIGSEINRIDTEGASGNEFAEIHAATFPVALAEYVCRKYTEKSVLDLFGGTGTTMIAAEKSGRKCYMMEIDPLYCDVVRRRWAEFAHGEGCNWKELTAVKE